MADMSIFYRSGAMNSTVFDCLQFITANKMKILQSTKNPADCSAEAHIKTFDSKFK